MYEQAFDRAGEPLVGEPAALWAALSRPPDHDDPVGYFAAGFARVAAQHGRPDLDTLAVARALRSVIDDRAVGLRPGATDALDAASAIGPIGVITNGPKARQQTKLDALGIIDRFETAVYAAELARSKPHTEPFEQAVADLDVAAERTLYVGNSLGYDVAGLPVAWLCGDDERGDYDPEYVIDSLGELPAILRGES